MNPTGRIIHVLRFQTICSCFSRRRSGPQRIDDLCPAQTQNNNLDKLGNFQKPASLRSQPCLRPAASRDLPSAKIKPPGFKIGLYALVLDARHIAVGPQGVAYFNTRKSKVYAVTDRGKAGFAEEGRNFAFGEFHNSKWNCFPRTASYLSPNRIVF